MKEAFKRGIISIIGIALVAYLIFLRVNGATIVQGEYAQANIMLYVILLLTYGAFTLIYGMWPIAIPMQRATLFVVWLALVFIGYYYLIDDPSNYIYISDLTKVAGALIMTTWPAGLLMSKKVKKQQAEKKVEIIEA